ncbi:MAG TPA: glycosyltransferase, partial [Thermoanaerobaculia bacterium]
GLEALRRDQGIGAAALMIQLPFWLPLARSLSARHAWPVVYDLMDLHSGFSSNTEEMLREEQELLETADLVLASSAVLEEQARRHNARVLPLKNACEYDRFAGATAPPGDTRGRPVVGYYGAISDWFDTGLVEELARRRPDWDFVLVGSTWGADVSGLEGLQNVRLPGEQPYPAIPGFLASFDVAILPFRRMPLTEATNPVKAYEILAGGKPLVAVPLPELTAMTPHVRFAETAEQFEREISAALADRGDATAAEARRAYAREHTWRARFAALAPAVAESFRKASIVVVTFHNRDLNRLCLESVFGRTEWPNFEVIVVDNGSTDGTPPMLRELARRHPALTVIENADNRGFAAANNQGLAVASGDYLVLLNNDTVVARGWLSRLIGHLAADSGLGLVGPTTNAIGNEQKVEPGYTDVGQMPAWAAELSRRRDGELADMPMIAMFCVAMRRAVWTEIGGLDERFAVGMFEDDDYCRRVRQAGYRIRVARDVYLHHWQRASFKLIGEAEYRRVFEENRRRYEEKWGAWIRPAGSAPPPQGRLKRQLEEVGARAAASPGVVVFLPSIGWDIPLFQRPHHLARAFARRGWVVVFDCSNANDDVDGFKEIEPNLFLYRGPDGVLPRLPHPILWSFPYSFELADGYPAGSRTVYDWIDDL